MEPPTDKHCLICFERQDTPSKLLIFSCNHTFCINCLPYLILNSLTFSKQILEFLSQSKETQFSCPNCSHDNAKIPSETFLQGLSHNSNSLCDGCDDQKAIYLCVECNKKFCDDCFVYIHKIKQYQNHSKFLIEEDSIKKFNCVCPGKHYLSHVCGTCKMAICPYCLKFEHEKHEVVPIQKPSQNFNESLQELFNTLGQIYNNLIKSVNSANEEFNGMIDEIILELQNIKKNNQEENLKFSKVSSSQNKTVQLVFEMVQKESSQKNLHPNKQFHISKSLNSVKFSKDPHFISKMFKVDEQRMESLFRIKNIVENLKGRFTIDLKKITAADLNDFKSNPIDLLQKKTILEEKTFCGGWWKSKSSCSFLINEETFVAWTGHLKKDQNTSNSPLNIYNVSQMKREASFPNDIDNVHLNFVSVFPRNDEIYGKKLLYCGDSSGVLRIYETSFDKKPCFKLQSKLQTKADQILSAVIFFDKFRELDWHNRVFDVEKLKEEEFLSFCYIIIATRNHSILLYKNTNNYYKDENWILHIQIKSPFDSYCCTLDYFHDEDLKKTRFYFGFNENHLVPYDLKSKIWEKTEFITKSNVTSINFIFRKLNRKSILTDEDSHKKEWIVIYTQHNCNSIILGNVGTGKIHQKADLLNVKGIYDCCLWNDGSSDNSGNYDGSGIIHLIASCEGVNNTKHSIIIIDFDTMNVLFVKKFSEYPINSKKILRKIKNNKGEEYNEEMVCFLESNEKSKVVLFQKKN